MTAPRITLAMLRGACKEQRDLFRKEWPEGAEVTIENVRRAQELGLNLVWGERWFTALALEAYDEAIAHSLKVYLEATAPAREAREEATAPAWEAYHKATAAVWKVYLEGTATAWCEAYIQSVAEREMQQ